MVGSFTRDPSGNVAVGVLKFDAATSVLIDTNDASKGLLTKAYDADDLLKTPTGTAQNFFLINASSTTSAAGTEITLTATTSDADVEAMIRVVDKILGDATDSAATPWCDQQAHLDAGRLHGRPDGRDRQGRRPPR